MHILTCTATDTDDAAVLAVAGLFLLYSFTDLLVHSLVFARRLS
jgi:hypothetical protein